MMVLKEIHADTLRGADLSLADLRGAYLGWADLSRADLSWADLSRADLRGAELHWANLRGANLRGANLSRAHMKGADLRGADLRGADLKGADLSQADLRGAMIPEDTPPVPDLDRQILEILHKNEGKLNMREWHTCTTTHCRAGWAIVLAGEKGRALEIAYGPSVAGALIYARAYPDLPVPDFQASKEEALEDMRARAAKQSL